MGTEQKFVRKKTEIVEQKRASSGIFFLLLTNHPQTINLIFISNNHAPDSY
jgi:hypothetical protein